MPQSQFYRDKQSDIMSSKKKAEDVTSSSDEYTEEEVEYEEVEVTDSEAEEEVIIVEGEKLVDRTYEP